MTDRTEERGLGGLVPAAKPVRTRRDELPLLLRHVLAGAQRSLVRVRAVPRMCRCLRRKFDSGAGGADRMTFLQSLLATDACLVRCSVRLRAYLRAGDLKSAAIERSVIDRLLDQRNRIKKGSEAS